MEIRTTCTFSDWTAMGGTWDRTGVCRVFEALRIAGIRHVYWRVFNGGLAMYRSQVAEVQRRQVYNALTRNNLYPFTNRPLHYLRDLDFEQFDPLPMAFELAEEFGIRMHLWYTIYEDEHSAPFQCRYNADNPQWWHMDREGHSYSGTFDFFFEEVRDYKLAIIDELLQYPSAGLMLDYVRHNATSPAGADGIYRFGYNPEICRAFKKQHGSDPRELAPGDPLWLDYQREINTSLVREIRTKMDMTGRRMDLALMLWPVNYADWACLDVPALCADGAVQTLSMFGLTYSMSAQEARQHFAVGTDQTASASVEVLPGLQVYNGVRGYQIENFVQAAEEAGAPGIVFHEADALIRYNCTSTVRSINLGFPDYERRLQATAISSADCDNPAAWQALPIFSSFLLHFGESDADAPAEKTEVQIGYSDSELLIRFRCAEQNMDKALAPPVSSRQNQYYIDALQHRAPYFDMNAFSVMLEPARVGEDFRQFNVTPLHVASTCAYIDENWRGEWQTAISTSEEGWSGLLRIPYKTLGCKSPEPGDVWGINLVRGIIGSGEKAIWYPIAWQKVCPHELGRLEFL